MTDPEDALSFKLKRAQFNHRLPVQLIDLFDEFGDDKKYLLEYVLWVACKSMGSRLAVMDGLEVKVLERYFNNVKNYLALNKQFGLDFTIFSKFEDEILTALA
nr:hypothetical protein [Candidatus Sigynarchaeota archaeon]